MKFQSIAVASFCVLAMVLMTRPAAAAAIKVADYGKSQGNSSQNNNDNNGKSSNGNNNDGKGNNNNSGNNSNNNGKGSSNCDDIKDCKDKSPRSQSVPCDNDHKTTCDNNSGNNNKGNDNQGKNNDKDNGHDNGGGKGK